MKRVYPHPYSMDWCWSQVSGLFFASGTTKTRHEAVEKRLQRREEFRQANRKLKERLR